MYKLVRSDGSWTETVLYAFDGMSEGGTPLAAPVFDRSGNLYSTTDVGGVNNFGTVFELSPAGSGWVETVLHSFGVGSDGAYPDTGLIFDSTSGNLYGATNEGGAGNYGTVYELVPAGGAWTYTMIYSFTGIPFTPQGPNSVDTIDISGNLYGTITTNGSNQEGAIFELSPGEPWVYMSLHDFTCGSDGGFPAPGMVLDASGNFFGAVLDTDFFSSCPSGDGGVFEISP